MKGNQSEAFGKEGRIDPATSNQLAVEARLMSVASEGKNDPCSGSPSKSLSSGKCLVVVLKIQS